MNDYLSNLIAKSFEIGEIIQPRPMSIFEPSAFEGVEPENVSNGTMLATPLSAHNPLPSSPMSPPTRPLEAQPHPPYHFSPVRMLKRSAVERSPAQTEGREQTSEPRPKPIIANTLPSPGVETAPATTPPPREPLIQPNIVRPSSQNMLKQSAGQQPRPLLEDNPDKGSNMRGVEDSRLLPVEPLIQQVIVEPILVSPEGTTTTVTDFENKATLAKPLVQSERRLVVEPPPSSERIFAPREQSESKMTQSKSMGPQDNHPMLEPTSTPKTAAVVRPQIVPYLEPIAPIPSPDIVPEPTATVQVTIGRVEVRATTPPPVPKPKVNRPKPPVMSLDEYLRQRAGGDRP